MDLPLSDFRRMEVEEFDTSKLLAHASKQAIERGYKDFPIVDVDSHHYESESIGEILDYMDDPVLQQLARSARQAANARAESARGGSVAPATVQASARPAKRAPALAWLRQMTRAART